MTAPVRDPAAPEAAIGGYGLETHNVRVQGEAAPVLDGVSIHVPRGSIYGLIGPSGAGKSTLLRVAATVQAPDVGTVIVDRLDATAVPHETRRRIGYLPDASGVYDDLTVDEHLMFYAAIYGLAPSHRRGTVDDLLELMRLTAYRHRPAGALSRGTRQMLGIARCLVHDPQLLLLDEPAAGLDSQSHAELLVILRQLAGLGKSVVLCSHLLPDVAQVSSYVGILQSGRLVTEGSLNDIVQAVSPYAQVRVRLLRSADIDTARSLLDAGTGFRNLRSNEEDQITAEYDGTREDLALSIERLIAAGVPVTDVALNTLTLDGAFERITGGGVTA